MARHEMTAAAREAQAEYRAWREEGADLTGEALGWHRAGLNLLRRARRLDHPGNAQVLRLAASELFDVAARIHVGSGMATIDQCDDCGGPADLDDSDRVQCECGTTVCSACCEAVDGESYCRVCAENLREQHVVRAPYCNASEALVAGIERIMEGHIVPGSVKAT